jgi:hypothetical protein
MIARLAVRLGAAEGDEADESAEISEESSAEIRVNPFDGKKEGGAA